MYIEYQVEAKARINIKHKINVKLNTKRMCFNKTYSITSNTEPTVIQNSTSLI